jgi:type I restriction enzyme S subunit
MRNIHHLLTNHLDIWTASDTEKKSGRGRNGANSTNVYGIKKLRELILDLAVQGKLVSQDSNDEPASELLSRIRNERDRQIKQESLKTRAKDVIHDSEMYITIPTSWEYCRLGNLAKFIDYRGKTPNKTSSGIPLITAKNVRFGYICRVPEEYITLADYSLWMTRGFPRNGDMLFTTEAPLGNIAIIDINEKFALAQRVICFQLHEQAIAAYLKIAIMSAQVQRQLINVATGMTAKGIKASKLKEVPIPIPPIEEQYRIVSKFDELMNLCDQLEAKHNNSVEAHEKLVSHLLNTLSQSQSAKDFCENWQRITAHFDILFTTESSIDDLKQTLLQLAVMGKLVPQDCNEESANDLLKRLQFEKTQLADKGRIKKYKSIQDEKKPFDLPHGWEWVCVQDLLDSSREISYGIIKLGNVPKSGGIMTLRCSDIKPGVIDLGGVRRVSEEIEKNYIRTRLSGGEILLNIRGTLGGVALVEPNLKGYNIAREVAVIPISQLLSGAFLVYVMRSNYFWNNILAELRGIAYKGLNLSALRLFPIPLPPILEQERIVRKVNELMALCDQLKARITEARKLQYKLADVLVEQTVNNFIDVN